jgi:16S rRNA processing protein RimM
MNKSSAIVVVAKIGTPFGVKGWVKVHSYTEIVTDILEYAPWYIEEKQDWQKLEAEECRPHGKGVIIKIKGYDSPETARVLTGKHIGISKDQLPKLSKNEFYWADLQGLTVINQEGQVLGVVSYLIETGSNDVLVVKGETEQAIPYLPDEVVTKVDLEKKEIHVNWDGI